MIHDSSSFRLFIVISFFLVYFHSLAKILSHIFRALLNIIKILKQKKQLYMHSDENTNNVLSSGYTRNIYNHNDRWCVGEAWLFIFSCFMRVRSWYDSAFKIRKKWLKVPKSTIVQESFISHTLMHFIYRNSVSLSIIISTFSIYLFLLTQIWFSLASTQRDSIVHHCQFYSKWRKAS